jgi:hypothetical protein
MVVPVAPTKRFASFLLKEREREIEKEKEKERERDKDRVTYKERVKYNTFYSAPSNFNAAFL